MILSVAVLLAACGGSSGGGLASSDQVQAGSRWSSPLSAGVYDDDNATLAVYAYADRQVAAIDYADSDYDNVAADFCDESVDVSDGVASVSDSRCKLTLAQTGDAIDATGSLLIHLDDQAPQDASLHFSKRAADALNGTYSGDNVTLTVESSADDQFTFSLAIDGEPVATHAHATPRVRLADTLTGNDQLDWFTATTDAGDCTYTMRLTRSQGKFHWFVLTDTGAAECTVGTSLDSP
jgi:hypothetical protein